MTAARRPPKNPAARKSPPAEEQPEEMEKDPSARPRTEKGTTPPRKDLAKKTPPRKPAAKPAKKNAPATSRKPGGKTSKKRASTWSEAAARRGATGSRKPLEKPTAFDRKKAARVSTTAPVKPASRAKAPGAPKLTPALRKRLAAIRLLILDVDGTLTDGAIWLGEHEELKGFHIADGLGLKALMRAGVDVAIVTGRTSAAVTRRARELGIDHLFQKTRDKTRCVGILQRRLGLEREAVASMGDDLVDFQLFTACGFNFAVADAAPELRDAADLVTSKPGGHGAAREAAELILKARGDWDAVVDRFRKS